MAAILDFQVATRTELFSIPMRIIMLNLVLVSQNARFFHYLPHYYLTVTVSLSFVNVALTEDATIRKYVRF